MHDELVYAFGESCRKQSMKGPQIQEGYTRPAGPNVSAPSVPRKSCAKFHNQYLVWRGVGIVEDSSGRLTKVPQRSEWFMGWNGRRTAANQAGGACDAPVCQFRPPPSRNMVSFLTFGTLSYSLM